MEGGLQIGGSFWGSLYEGSCEIGSRLDAPDFWKLSYGAFRIIPGSFLRYQCKQRQGVLFANTVASTFPKLAKPSALQGLQPYAEPCIAYMIQ